MVCRDYHTLYGRPFTVLRYGIPYGPAHARQLRRGRVHQAGVAGRAAYASTATAARSGSSCTCEDLARRPRAGVGHVAENRTYNLDGAEPVSIRRIAETVRDLVGNVEVRFGPPRPGDLKARVVSTDRAHEELGWIPRVSFGEGMRQTLAWYIETLGLDLQLPEPVTLEDGAV